MKKICGIILVGLLTLGYAQATNYTDISLGGLGRALEKNKPKNPNAFKALYFLLRGINENNKPEDLVDDSNVQKVIKQLKPLVTKKIVQSLDKKQLNNYLTFIEENADLLRDLELYATSKKIFQMTEDMHIFNDQVALLFQLMQNPSIHEIAKEVMITQLFRSLYNMYPKILRERILEKLSQIKGEGIREFLMRVYNNVAKKHQITKIELLDYEEKKEEQLKIGEIEEEAEKITVPSFGSLEHVNRLGLGLHQVKK